MTDIDLGHGHTYRFVGWYPDDLPGNRTHLGISDGEPMPSIEKAVIFIDHKKPNGEECGGAVTLDTPETRRWKLASDDHRWQVESWEPLTISPSILCRLCDDHGFIRDGKWVSA